MKTKRSFDFWCAVTVAAIFCAMAAIIVDSTSSQPIEGAAEICRSMYGHKIPCPEDR